MTEKHFFVFADVCSVIRKGDLYTLNFMGPAYRLCPKRPIPGKDANAVLCVMSELNLAKC